MKHKNIPLTAMLIAALAACQNNDYDMLQADSQALKAVPMNFGTRNANEGNSFDTGDVVAVHCSNNEQTTFTLGEGGTWADAQGNSYLLVQLPTTLTAVHPATEKDATKFAMAGTLSNRIYAVDQSTADKLRAADYMTSDEQTVATAPTDAVNFTLKHRMCKVTITISGYGTEFGDTPPTLTDETIYTNAYDITNYYGPWDSNRHSDIDAVTITPLKTSAEGGLPKYEAIVCCRASYNAGDKLMTLTVNGVAKDVLINKETWFGMGVHYNFNLKVGNDKVEITDITIGAWGDNTTTNGNTTNIALPNAGSNGTAGIFVNYNSIDYTNAENMKLSAASYWAIEHTWASQTATPQIIIYSPYAEGITYTGTLELSNGYDEAVDDYRYASINADHSKTVSQLLTDGKLVVSQDEFKHKMCKLSIAFKDASGNAVTPTSVTLKDFYDRGSLTINSGKVTIYGGKTNVGLPVTTGKCDDYYIVPQTIDAGSLLITATIDGKSYNYYTDSTNGLKLAEGEYITLTLSLPAARSRAAAVTNSNTTERMNASITINNSWK